MRDCDKTYRFRVLDYPKYGDREPQQEHILNSVDEAIEVARQLATWQKRPVAIYAPGALCPFDVIEPRQSGSSISTDIPQSVINADEERRREMRLKEVAMNEGTIIRPYSPRDV